MRYAVISDIHANLEALQATLDDIEDQDVQKIVCLGDIVGYYPNPNECTEICRKNHFWCLRGNHDDAVAGICGIEDFNPTAKEALLWTANNLKTDNKEWLYHLPEQIIVNNSFLAVHGSPWHSHAYIFSPESVTRAFSYLQSHFPHIRLCFFGHTHQRAIYYYSSNGVSQKMLPKTKIRINKTGLYLINPGSVGQARDGKPGASYVIYDTEKKEMEFRHVLYDVNLTQRKTAAAGLPAVLAERLKVGY